MDVKTHVSSFLFKHRTSILTILCLLLAVTIITHFTEVPPKSLWEPPPEESVTEEVVESEESLEKEATSKLIRLEEYARIVSQRNTDWSNDRFDDEMSGPEPLRKVWSLKPATGEEATRATPSVSFHADTPGFEGQAGDAATELRSPRPSVSWAPELNEDESSRVTVLMPLDEQVGLARSESQTSEPRAHAQDTDESTRVRVILPFDRQAGTSEAQVSGSRASRVTFAVPDDEEDSDDDDDDDDDGGGTPPTDSQMTLVSEVDATGSQIQRTTSGKTVQSVLSSQIYDAATTTLMDMVLIQEQRKRVFWAGTEGQRPTTPSHRDICNTLLINSIKLGDRNAFNMALSLGADCWVRTEASHDTILHIVAQYGNYEFFEAIINQCPSAPINALNKFGESPMHDAIQHNSVDICKGLMRAGADVNIRNMRNQTPLHSALRWNRRRIIIMLLEDENTNLELVDDYGHTPLTLAIIEKSNFRAAKALLELNADPYVLVHNRPLIHRATFFHSASRERCIRLLLQYGVDVNTVDVQGVTPLHLACQAGFMNLVQLYVEHGADLSAKDQIGRTPLDLAQLFEQHHVVKYLQQIIDDTIDRDFEQFYDELYGRPGPSGVNNRDSLWDTTSEDMERETLE